MTMIIVLSFSVAAQVLPNVQKYLSLRPAGLLSIFRLTIDNKMKKKKESFIVLRNLILMKENCFFFKHFHYQQNCA